jgi:hypothetical protein
METPDEMLGCLRGSLERLAQQATHEPEYPCAKEGTERRCLRTKAAR